MNSKKRRHRPFFNGNRQCYFFLFTAPLSSAPGANLATRRRGAPCRANKFLALRMLLLGCSEILFTRFSTREPNLRPTRNQPLSAMMHAEILIANASKNSIFLSDERAPAPRPDCSGRVRYLAPGQPDPDPKEWQFRKLSRKGSRVYVRRCE